MCLLTKLSNEEQSKRQCRTFPTAWIVQKAKGFIISSWLDQYTRGQKDVHSHTYCSRTFRLQRDIPRGCRTQDRNEDGSSCISQPSKRWQEQQPFLKVQSDLCTCAFHSILWTTNSTDTAMARQAQVMSMYKRQEEGVRAIWIDHCL